MNLRRAFLSGLAACLTIALSSSAGCGQVSQPPLALHPDNPHYLLFRGRPAILVTSGEHYGAVMNSDFDYVRYLDELKRCGLNLTRTFSGCYMEPSGAFNITRNTLAPAAGKLICPWARSPTPGFANGGAKFDLTKFDPAYFERLRDFVAQAGRRGVVVELSLFCPFYEDSMWNISPMNAANNVNGVGNLKRTDALTLRNGKLLDVQLEMARKIVRELNGFDNLYYEICNEPYVCGVPLDWQHRVAETIRDTERTLPNRHLLAQNIANDGARTKDPHPAVSIFNFHYSNATKTVSDNYHLNKPIADDETGFRGTGDQPYRVEAWEFLLAGGAIFSNLDYSFTADTPDGTFFPLPAKQPGGGGKDLRKQVSIVKGFVEGFDFVRMKPDRSVIAGGVPAKGAAWCLALPGKAYAIYVRGEKSAKLTLDLPAGQYKIEWINTLTGATDKSQTLDHKGGKVTLESPPYQHDVALRLLKQ